MGMSDVGGGGVVEHAEEGCANNGEAGIWGGREGGREGGVGMQGWGVWVYRESTPTHPVESSSVCLHCGAVCFQGDVIPSLERLFHVGALMPCCVTAVGGRKVSLSVNPRLVNTHLTAKDIRPNMVGMGMWCVVGGCGCVVCGGWVWVWVWV